MQYATQTRQQARAAAVTQRTCYKEKQAFSERVVDDVGDATLQRQPRAEDGERQAEEHPAKLSDGRPGQQPLHILLWQIHQKAIKNGDQCHDHANAANHMRDIAAVDNGAGKNVNAHFHHRCGVEIVADRCWRFHCVR
ncbi:Uncharacterised protein [Shigella flexneri]|nr:Uncharacterised protein [Shigella flexneri]